MSSPAETSPITRADVVRIAELANLALTADETDRMTHELEAILGHVRQLEEVDVSGVAPTAHVQIEALALRPDVPHESLPRELALREAPRSTEGGFAVPQFVDEG